MHYLGYMSLEVYGTWRSHLHLSHLVTVFYESVTFSSSSQLKYFSINVNCMPSNYSKWFLWAQVGSNKHSYASALFCAHIECVWWITNNTIFIAVKLPSPTTLSRWIKLLEMLNSGMSVHRSLITWLCWPRVSMYECMKIQCKLFTSLLQIIKFSKTITLY